MINSMTIEFNNQNIVQQTPFLNVFRSFKCLTSWSKDDLETHGPSCGFCPDSADSWAYNLNFSADSNFNSLGQNIVLTNNRNCLIKGCSVTTSAFSANSEQLPLSDVVGVPTLTGTEYTYGGVQSTAAGTNAVIYAPTTSNAGMLQRQKDVLYNTSAAAGQSGLGQSALNTQTACDSVYRNSKTAAAGCHTWKVYAKLRLKDLADF